jgi:hypothetical protein
MLLWYLININMHVVWDLALNYQVTGDLILVTIGIIDIFADFNSGVGDFQERIEDGIPSTSFAFNHGTKNAALCCAQGNNSYGNVGVNWWNRVRLYDAGWFNAKAKVSELLVRALRDRVKVISVSIAPYDNPPGDCSWYDRTFRGAYHELMSNFVRRLAVDYPEFILVMASGNDSCERQPIPGKPERLVFVGASTIENKRAEYSDYGPLIDVAAPVGDVRTGVMGWRNPATKLIESFEGGGTSFAAPQVAAAAALVWGTTGGMTAEDVTRRLKDSAYKGKDGLGISEFAGAGVLDVHRALGGTGDVPDETPPTVPKTLTAAPLAPTEIRLAWDASFDNVGITGYKVYRDGQPITAVTGTVTTDTGRLPQTQYCYEVSAYDAAGKDSARSKQACATTPVAYVVDNSAYNAVAPGNPVNTFQGLGHLEGTIRALRVYTEYPYWWNNIVNVSIMECDLELPTDWSSCRGVFSQSGVTNGEYAQWDNLSVPLDMGKWYYLDLAGDWKPKGTTYDSYPNGRIENWGSSIGNLQDIAFIIWGARVAISRTISGRIATPGGVGVPNVRLTLGQSGAAPVNSDAVGNYRFLNVLGGSYTVTPTAIGYVFEPPQRSVTVSDLDITGQDFVAHEIPRIDNSAYDTVVPGFVTGMYQSLGWLAGTIVGVRVYAECRSWWACDWNLLLAIMECDSAQLGPDCRSLTWMSGPTNSEYVEWHGQSIAVDPSKYYYLYYASDWRPKGTTYNGYPNGEILSGGSSYSNVGNMQDFSFILWGVSAAP